MPDAPQPWDTTKFINHAQIGGIDSYVCDAGPARGVRALCVNTGGGLRCRILVDRGMDIDQAFWNATSLSFLTHAGVSGPSRALDRAAEWLKGFPGGLLTSCGPFNIGPPDIDGDEALGLHGGHSNTAATIESVIQPDPFAGRPDMALTGIVRYGRLFGPNVELRRTIRSTLGRNALAICDEFTNVGNETVPHAWLLHINFGYPLVDAGAELCYGGRVVPRPDPASQAHFAEGRDFRRIPGPQQIHCGTAEAVAYLYPKALSRDGRTTVAIVNRKRQLAVAVHYNVTQFGCCANWQHWGPREYVTALEPMNGTVQGRSHDRAHGLLDHLDPGQRKRYEYSIEVVTSRTGIAALRRLSKPLQRLKTR